MVSETEPEQSGGLPGCECEGDFSVGGCQGLPNQRVAVPTDEGMYGKMCDP